MNSTSSLSTALQNNSKVFKNAKLTKERMLETLNKSSNLKKSKSYTEPDLAAMAKKVMDSGKEAKGVGLKPVKLQNLNDLIADTHIDEFSEEELARIEKYGFDDILSNTEACKTIITEEDSQEEEIQSSNKCESTANSTVKSTDKGNKAQCLEISIPDYLVTEKVEEESSPLEAGSALIKDLSTNRESFLNATISKRSAKAEDSSAKKPKNSTSAKKYCRLGQGTLAQPRLNQRRMS